MVQLAPLAQSPGDTWCGPWSDTDVTRWEQHPDVAVACGRGTGQKHGDAFWMEDKDFQEYFCAVYLADVPEVTEGGGGAAAVAAVRDAAERHDSGCSWVSNGGVPCVAGGRELRGRPKGVAGRGKGEGQAGGGKRGGQEGANGGSKGGGRKEGDRGGGGEGDRAG